MRTRNVRSLVFWCITIWMVDPLSRVLVGHWSVLEGSLLFRSSLLSTTVPFVDLSSSKTIPCLVTNMRKWILLSLLYGSYVKQRSHLDRLRPKVKPRLGSLSVEDNLITSAWSPMPRFRPNSSASSSRYKSESIASAVYLLVV